MAKYSILPLLAMVCIINAHSQPQRYLTLKLKKGDTLANIYSRTIAFTGDDFMPLTWRVSGSSTYTVVDANPQKPVFDNDNLYDGRQASKGTYQASLAGSDTYNGKPSVNLNASGLLYNEVIWGKIPQHLKEGSSWTVHLDQPWELGGIGTQIVTVLTLDAAHETVTLKRQGTSVGFYDNDTKKLEVTTKDAKKTVLDLTPGRSHWQGITTFKNGIVLNDELLVVRPITLSSDSLHFTGSERQYILLNAMPPGQ